MIPASVVGQVVSHGKRPHHLECMKMQVSYTISLSTREYYRMLTLCKSPHQILKTLVLSFEEVFSGCLKLFSLYLSHQVPAVLFGVFSSGSLIRLDYLSTMKFSWGRGIAGSHSSVVRLSRHHLLAVYGPSKFLSNHKSYDPDD
jgi:hypothetical protein